MPSLHVQGSKNKESNYLMYKWYLHYTKVMCRPDYMQDRRMKLKGTPYLPSGLNVPSTYPQTWNKRFSVSVCPALFSCQVPLSGMCEASSCIFYCNSWHRRFALWSWDFPWQTAKATKPQTIKTLSLLPLSSYLFSSLGSNEWQDWENRRHKHSTCRCNIGQC